MSMKKNNLDLIFDEIVKKNEIIRKEKNRKAFLLNGAIKEIKALDIIERKQALDKLATYIYLDEMTEPYTRLMSQNGVLIKNVPSFKQLLIQATRRRQLYDFQPEWRLNNKTYAYKFVDRLGVRRPETYQSGVSLEKISLRRKSVLKPEGGSSSHGVFILGADSGFEVATGQKLNSFNAVLSKASEYLRSKHVKNNVWLLEEFVGEVDKEKISAPVDLKFYSFFGKVAFVLEVERAEKTRYCSWMPDGSLVDIGIFKPEDTFVGKGFSKNNILEVERLSSEIKAPFMRIDFIKSEDDFVFGEFTPRPGQFSLFNNEFDIYLGECYMRAEARLIKYLMKEHV
ncbi:MULTISPECIES: ATP-grasp fold amidoligase family protein [Halomonadaceae]|uniref:ATP-grasp fold amidoligase family protein n=1 Tax=Halomonadaceae TaxID=28256 RepID=UPI0018665328|nr:ATP-grasp fold amidoligase family protein [Halomonas sp. 3A7M]